MCSETTDGLAGGVVPLAVCAVPRRYCECSETTVFEETMDSSAGGVVPAEKSG